MDDTIYQHELKKSEERFRAIFENALEAIIIWDENFYIVNANKAASRMFELPLQELEKKTIVDFINKNDPHAISVYKDFKESGEIREELIFEMPNGEKKQLEFTSNKGVINGYNLTIFRNVSERNRMEKNLRESEQKFRRIFDSVVNGILLCNEKFEIVDANHMACKIIGISKDDLIAKKFLSIVSPEMIKNLQKYINEYNELGKVSGQIPIKFSNGIVKHIEFSSKLDDILGLNLIIFTDVTARKEMEDRLRKSDTLNVVGELAAGIAHEIRNPMTALKGFIQLLQSNMKEDFSSYFDVIQSELKRIESIITEFLVLAKPQAIQFKQSSITKIMKETIDLLTAQASLHNVQILSRIEGVIPYIYCEANQLKQVFINMLKNAIEVMQDGGIITVSIKEKNDKEVLVSIRDEGCGISQDKIARLGEPFYTTKERGTGLGLMVSYKIIEEHHGSILVDSKPGKGTTFYITLPKDQD